MFFAYIGEPITVLVIVIKKIYNNNKKDFESLGLNVYLCKAPLPPRAEQAH